MSGIGHRFTALTNKWRSVQDALPARAFSGTPQGAISLADGRGFVAGGEDFDTMFFDSCFFYDITTGLFTPTGNYLAPRASPIVQLNDNDIVAVGGTIAGYNTTPTCERFNLRTNAWTATGALAHTRDRHRVVKLQSGKLFTTGGNNSSGVSLDTSELYDPTLGTWSATGSLAGGSRTDFIIQMLLDGKVLIAGGGRTGGGPPTVLGTAEIYDPGTGLCTATAHNLNVARRGAAAILLNDGRVLIISGDDGVNSLVSCEIYDPASQTFTLTGNLNVGHSLVAFAFKLHDGDIVIAGGVSNMGTSEAIDVTEVFSLNTHTWRVVSPLNTKRYFTSGFLTAHGDPVMVGGVTEGFLPTQKNELRVS